MKKIIGAFITLFSITALHAQTTHISGEVMVMLKPGEVAKKFIQGLNETHPGANFQLAMEVTNEWNIWLLSYDTQFISDEASLYLLARREEVSLAQYNYPVQTRVTTPNDPSFASQQWGLNNTGQTGGTADADVDAPEAWDITTGGLTADGDEIVVAVIDGGFQNNHPDLTANYWVNAAEIAGNGIDDDGNGYIDDVDGWNAYNGNGTIPSNQHGTHVAGIIGAKGNNGIGVSGVNWDVKIMRVAGSSGNSATVVAAYAYVAKQRKIYNQTNGAQGAFVVSTNSSFGVDFGDAADFPIWCAFYDTLGTLGILSAGAGPNANTNIDTQGDIPTTCPSQYLIAVTNTRNNDTKNSGAGYGPIHMDMGAPGTSIYSTVTGSSYANLTGTSMATPHVAGAIGLYYSAACSNFISNYKANPAGGAFLMRTFLLTGVDSISSLANNTSSKGRLNLNKGIQQVLNGCLIVPPNPPVASFTLSQNSVCEGETLAFTDASSNSPTSWYWNFPGGSPASSILQNPSITYNMAGSYSVNLSVTGAGGIGQQTVNGAVTVNPSPATPSITENAGVFLSSYTTGNQWYDANGAIGGANGQSYTPSVNGSYYVIHTDANGCVSQASPVVWLTASIEETYFSTLRIYPNPVSSSFTISWDNANANVESIRVVDALGRVVYQRKLLSGTNIHIESAGWAHGAYTVELQSDKGNVKRKLVK